jgi:CRP-like cAMP-binding protein
MRIDFSAIEVLCHLASALEFAAFLQHNMLSLRILEMAAAIMQASYSLVKYWKANECHFVWSILHFSINAYHVAKYAHRYCHRFNDEETKLWKHTVFSIYSRAEFAEIKRKAEWDTYGEGDSLLMAEHPVNRLLLLFSGSAQVVAMDDGREQIIKTLNAQRDGPQFVGELAFFTKERPHVTVRVSSNEARVLSWEMSMVRHLTHAHGHSLEVVAFRQLPSLLAHQAAKRVKEITKKAATRRFHLSFESERSKNSSKDSPEAKADDSSDSEGCTDILRLTSRSIRVTSHGWHEQTDKPPVPESIEVSTDDAVTALSPPASASTASRPTPRPLLESPSRTRSASQME